MNVLMEDLCLVVSDMTLDCFYVLFLIELETTLKVVVIYSSENQPRLERHIFKLS